MSAKARLDVIFIQTPVPEAPSIEFRDFGGSSKIHCLLLPPQPQKRTQTLITDLKEARTVSVEHLALKGIPLTTYRSYEKMALYYDWIYRDIVDYEAQTTHLQSILETHSKRKVESILDVACGTGNYSFVLAKLGYQVTGVDNSSEMISKALEKKTEDSNPKFFAMDMRQMRLNGKYDAALVLFGGFGYLVTESAIRKFLRSVKKHVATGGLLIYEFWQSSAIRKEAMKPEGYRTWDRIEDKRKGLVLIRLATSKYDKMTRIDRIAFDFYVLNIKGHAVEDMFSETHEMMTHSIYGMKSLLKENGYTRLAFYTADVDRALRPAESSDFRVLAVSTLARPYQ